MVGLSNMCNVATRSQHQECFGAMQISLCSFVLLLLVSDLNVAAFRDRDDDDDKESGDENRN